jgi:hypothetical protein
MDSEMFAEEMLFELELERPRKGLTAMLSLATIAVWTFAAVASAQAAAPGLH